MYHHAAAAAIVERIIQCAGGTFPAQPDAAIRVARRLGASVYVLHDAGPFEGCRIEHRLFVAFSPDPLVLTRRVVHELAHYLLDTDGDPPPVKCPCETQHRERICHLVELHAAGATLPPSLGLGDLREEPALVSAMYDRLSALDG